MILEACHQCQKHDYTHEVLFGAKNSKASDFLKDLIPKSYSVLSYLHRLCLIGLIWLLGISGFLDTNNLVLYKAKVTKPTIP